MALDRELSPYEVEVGAAMTARRDAGVRLKDALCHDVAGYDGGMELVAAGRAMEILSPPTAGSIRQGMSEAINEFEAARHRFRLALVAVAMDHGLTAREIGEAFGFSRQLASRYLKEARQKWPVLEAHEDDAGPQRQAHDLVAHAPTANGAVDG
jgi:hypothetical protein